MDQDNLDSGFQKYRRERNRRRMDQGPLRPLGQNAAVLKELEAAEEKEVRNQQLTREVHEFFADATRTAATIVSKVAEVAEEQKDQSLGVEMSDFLADTIRRAHEFINLLQRTGDPNAAHAEIEANMQNIVGARLDEFRYEGTAQVADKHIGLDPFAESLESSTWGAPAGGPADASPAPDTTDVSTVAGLCESDIVDIPHDISDDIPDGMCDDPEEVYDDDDVPMVVKSRLDDRDEPQLPAASIDEHLVAEVSPGGDPDLFDDPLRDWFDRLGRDQEQLKRCLKLLVKNGLMEKDEARLIYRETKHA